MTDDRAQNVVAGCLGRVFTLLGFFWGAAVVASAIGFISEGDLPFETIGVFIPAVILIGLGRAIRRRARPSSGPDTAENRARTRAKSGSQIPAPPKRVPPQSTTSPEPVEVQSKPRPEIPELPTVEPVHDPGELPGVTDLSMEDFETDQDRPMTSQELIDRARERFNKKPD